MEVNFNPNSPEKFIFSVAENPVLEKAKRGNFAILYW